MRFMSVRRSTANTVTGFPQRGTARFFAVTVLEDGATPWGGAVVGSMIDSQIALEANGYFELILSPDPLPDNWVKTAPGAWRVTFRQFFADWENEESMVTRIDVLDPVANDPEIKIQQIQTGLAANARWVNDSSRYRAVKGTAIV